jgi:N utilization substance protein B
MKASRKKTRRHLVQKLYSRIYGELDTVLFNEAFFDWRFDFDPDIAYMDEMFFLVVEKQHEILGVIKTYAPKFDLETMMKTNIIALSIAITEMLWLKEEIPAKVSINEAIDLSKYYGDDNSKNIVNGILNSFFTNIEKHQKGENNTLTSVSFFC